MKRAKITRKLETLPDILKNEIDVYNSRYVDQSAVEENLTNFESILDNTLSHFSESKVKGFFITISLKSHSHLFSLLSNKNFVFHNAEGDKATLVSWLPKNRKNRLPGFSTHYVGVGGLVIDFETKKVLVIKEKNGHDTKGWKIPGGLIDLGEYIPEAVEREVKEETGIDAEFCGIVGLREKTPYHFGRNDIYFFCLLKPSSQVITQCQDEIQNSIWIDVEELCEFEHRVQTQRRIAKIAKRIIEKVEAGADIGEVCWEMDSVTTKLPTLTSDHPIYHSKL